MTFLLTLRTKFGCATRSPVELVNIQISSSNPHAHPLKQHFWREKLVWPKIWIFKILDGWSDIAPSSWTKVQRTQGFFSSGLCFSSLVLPALCSVGPSEQGHQGTWLGTGEFLVTLWPMVPLPSLCCCPPVWKDEHYHLRQGIGKDWLMSRTLKSADKKQCRSPHVTVVTEEVLLRRNQGHRFCRPPADGKASLPHSQQWSQSLTPGHVANTSGCMRITEYFFMRLIPNVSA